MPDSPAPDLQLRVANALAGKYAIERQLGQGGMGTVFLGRDESLDRQVAIKVIAPEMAASPELRQRFIQEARTVAKLRHPNIVAVYAAGEAEGLLYFVMEFVPGESLRDRMMRERPMPVEDGIAILRDLALALDYAHSSGIVHRDVKPENVLLDRDTGRAMLTDFGVARALAAAGDGRLTGTGFVLGSPKYMSPEQASGDGNLDGRSDLYSLGLIGYELFSGVPAIEATTAASMLVKQLTERPQPLGERRPDLAPELARVIDRALEKDPNTRFQRGAEFAAALAGETFDDTAPAWQAGRSAPHATRRRRTRSRKTLVALSIATATVLAIAATFVYLSRNAVNEREWLVAPFEVQGGDPSMSWLREGSLNMLTLSLAQWQDLHVVEYERTLDLLRDAKLEDANRPIGLSAARSLARKTGAGRLVMGQVTFISDSMIVDAKLYDVRTGLSRDKARAVALRNADPRPLFDKIAADLLDLQGAPRVTGELAKQTTTSVTAYRYYLEGLGHLNNWRLRAADSLFGRAIAADTTFALAYYKKALTMGWMQTMDSSRRIASEKSVEYAERLPPHMAELVRGHDELTQAFFAAADTNAARNNYLASRNRLAKLVAQDSTNAEAWYALADADYHLIWSTSYGRSADSTAKYLTESLRGFQRTLALDPTFHLAFQHLVEMYSQAAVPRSYLVLIGDTIKPGGRPEDERLIGTAEQVNKLRQAALTRALDAAKGWMTADPDAASARRVVANIYVQMHQPDSAIGVLQAALKRPLTADPAFSWMLPYIKARNGLKGAGPEMLQVVSRTQVDSFRTLPIGVRIQAAMGAVTVAAATGVPSIIDSATSLLAKTDPMLPGQHPVKTDFVMKFMGAGVRAGMGIPVSPAARSTLVNGIKGLEEIGIRTGADVTVPYMAYLQTGDSVFLNTIYRWSPNNSTGFPELQALAALRAGDTAQAEKIASAFPSVDSIRSAVLGMNGMRVATRAAVLAELGDIRKAIAYYEAIDPVRFQTPQTSNDIGWPIYVRSYMDRARLYEKVGDRAQAIASYEKFLALWANAEEPLQPQLRVARENIARLREGSPAVPVKARG